MATTAHIKTTTQTETRSSKQTATYRPGNKRENRALHILASTMPILQYKNKENWENDEITLDEFKDEDILLKQKYPEPPQSLCLPPRQTPKNKTKKK